MGAIIKLKNINIGQSPLGRLDSATLAGSVITLRPSIGRVDAKLPSGITITSVGSPVFTAAYMQGDGITNYLKTNYSRDSTKDFTLAVVVKRDAKVGLQFYAGDYHNISHPTYKYDTGMGILATTTQGLRPSLILDSGSVFAGSGTPEALVSGVNLGEWYFACLTVNAAAKTGTFHVPSLGVEWVQSWAGALKPMQADENLTFLGNEGGASGSASQLAFSAFYERALSKSEVLQQYALAKSYCASNGVIVN